MWLVNKHFRRKAPEAETNLNWPLLKPKNWVPKVMQWPNVCLIWPNTYAKQGKFDDAERLIRKALAMKERQSGPLHKDVVPFLENYSRMLKSAGRTGRSGQLEKKAIAIFFSQIE